MINITLLFLGPARDLGASDQVRITLKDASSIAAFKLDLVKLFPKVERMITSLRFAVNEEFCDDAHVLRDGDVIALIPPVSGG